MPVQIPQLPQNLWQTILNIFAWAWRIPLACFVIFTCASSAFLGFFMIFRATAWIYQSCLANPW